VSNDRFVTSPTDCASAQLSFDGAAKVTGAEEKITRSEINRIVK
jgi:hypothetical protein